LPRDRDVVRDAGIGTVGGGNHFVEIQVVDEILDRRNAHAWGVRKGMVSIMIHSGSRLVGVHVGNTWMARARERWPAGVAHPRSGIYPLHGEDAAAYVTAMNAAANYASVNRLLLAELVRLRVREVYGPISRFPWCSTCRTTSCCARAIATCTARAPRPRTRDSPS
jgi:tRNA-splicing ligase RtcB